MLTYTFGEFKEVFRHGVASIEMRNGRADQGPLVLTPEGIRVMERLQRQTPRPQRVRVAGKVDAIRHSDHAFTLILSSGEQIRGVLADDAPDALAVHFGKLAIVSGTAQFRPSGSLLRVDADFLELADEADLALWSFSPRPLFAASDLQEPRRPQSSRSGVSAILGAWPGDETDDEIFAILEEMS